MKIPVRCRNRLNGGLVGLAILAACEPRIVHNQQPIAATAPTSSITPEVIDAQWKQATAAFDGERERLLSGVDAAVATGPYRTDWESLDTYQIPEWYRDAKFGIFIHWGVYSVPAFGNEWYPRNMYRKGSPEYEHHLATFGPQDRFGYKDFIPMFMAEHFEPDAWARLFRDAGAKYVIPVAEHHDGFAMYDSSLTSWSAVKMGPHRDIIGELRSSVAREGLHFGVSSHRIEHDFFLGVGREISSDVNDPRYAAFYGPAHSWLKSGDPNHLSDDFTYVSPSWTDDWLARSAELVEEYHPEIVYFDWWIGHPAARSALARFAAFYYNQTLHDSGQVGIINYKNSAMEEHSAVLDIERGQMGDSRELPWQTDTSVSNRSWGYIRDDTFKSPGFIVRQLVDIVSKNGNLLLNIGPRSDGTIPDEVQVILRRVGEWLAVNGESIYATRPWKVSGEGPTKTVSGAFHDTETDGYAADDFRFTAHGDIIYAIEMAQPGAGEVVIHSLCSGNGNPQVSSVKMLATGTDVPFEQKPDGLHLRIVAAPPPSFAYVYRVILRKP
jgi:alpha-L-fucosidase